MSDNDYFNMLWFTDYLGIGYACDKKGWLVFPVFSSSTNAKMIWNKHIEPLEEQTLKMRFIEEGSEYKFVLYPLPLQKGKLNFGLYRSLSFSQTYNKFRRSLFGKVFFSFGTIGDGLRPDIFSKRKLVSDVKFLKKADVNENSVEWIVERVQEQMRRDKNE